MPPNAMRNVLPQLPTYAAAIGFNSHTPAASGMGLLEAPSSSMPLLRPFEWDVETGYVRILQPYLKRRWSTALGNSLAPLLTRPGQKPPTCKQMHVEIQKLRLLPANIALLGPAAGDAAPPDAAAAAVDAAAPGGADTGAGPSTALRVVVAPRINPAGPHPVSAALAASHAVHAQRLEAAAPFLQPQDLPSVDEAAVLKKAQDKLHADFRRNINSLVDKIEKFSDTWPAANIFFSIGSPHSTVVREDGRGPFYLLDCVLKVATTGTQAARALGRKCQIHPPAPVLRVEEPSKPAMGPKSESQSKQTCVIFAREYL